MVRDGVCCNFACPVMSLLGMCLAFLSPELFYPYFVLYFTYFLLFICTLCFICIVYVPRVRFIIITIIPKHSEENLQLHFSFHVIVYLITRQVISIRTELFQHRLRRLNWTNCEIHPFHPRQVTFYFPQYFFQCCLHPSQ